MRKFSIAIVSLLSLLFLVTAFTSVDWGFYGHRKINRMAVFTLPPDMMVFYKKNIEYITDHAVDPDKRRYATKHEAVRHYIDLDHWGAYPFEDFPRTQLAVLMEYTDIFIVNQKNDTIQLFGHQLKKEENEIYLKYQISKKKSVVVPKKTYRSFFYNNIFSSYYEDEWLIDCDSMQQYFGDQIELDGCQKVFGVDTFSEYGVLPFHLVRMQNKLTTAFKRRNIKSILRLSAEMGHYIGDAHVPLHTTENYNGQLTNQNGIHAFWESRIPELFAEKEYDFFVGKAEYIEKKNDFFWDVILTSHSLLDSVLNIEKEMVQTFPEDQQFCFDDRNGRTIRTQCREFAKAYSDRMQGMVEDRMAATVYALGSLWYTAWVDAGQPDLSNLGKNNLSKEEQKELEELENAFRKGEIKGRVHGN